MTMETFTPIEYLEIDIASSFGLSKKLWSERLDWFADNKHEIESIARMDFFPSSHRLLREADEPALFYAGIKAWEKASRGEAINYPINLDATASGVQILAVLVDCFKSGRLCNLVDTGQREDLYKTLVTEMLNRIGSSVTVDPAKAKKAIMTAFYGSTAQPKRIFGEGPELEIFYDTLAEEAPGAWSLNEALLDLWQPHALEHSWRMPDNFLVRIKVMTPVEHHFQLGDEDLKCITYHNIGSETGLSLPANVAHSVDGFIFRELGRRCAYDRERIGELHGILDEIDRMGSYSVGNHASPNHDLVQTLWDQYLKTGYLSTRILELLDAENLLLVDLDVIRRTLKTLPAQPFRVLGVHDCFRCHPNYGNDMRRQYNRILSEIADSEILSSIISDIAGYPLPANKMGGNLATYVLEANYALS